MRVLDLFAGAGGAGVGYARAGFEVVAVDNEAHPDNPHTLIVADALEVLADVEFCRGFDLIHASPCCWAYSALRVVHQGKSYPTYVEPVREALRVIGVPYIIENVVGAPLVNPVKLCGSAFDLGAVCRDGVYRQLRRHRLFEHSADLWLWGQDCQHKGEPIGVYGHGGAAKTTENPRRGYQGYHDESRVAMGIDWMRQHDLSQAIPPAYTEYLGRQVVDQLGLSVA